MRADSGESAAGCQLSLTNPPHIADRWHLKAAGLPENFKRTRAPVPEV
jgi:hypothetical protein